jgi:hypothetical protein
VIFFCRERHAARCFFALCFSGQFQSWLFALVAGGFPVLRFARYFHATNNNTWKIPLFKASPDANLHI